MITVALSHLLSRGVRLDTAEAVAIARALSNATGEPAIDNIELSSDGDARCAGGRGEPSVTALAGVLDTLLPPRGVPAPLRYAVARGLETVVAPPFASVEEFSAALARFDCGDPREILKHLLTRVARQPARPIVADPAGDVVLVRAMMPESSQRWQIRAWQVAAALALSGLAGFAVARAVLPGPPALPPRAIPAAVTGAPVSTLGTFPRDSDAPVGADAVRPAPTPPCRCPPDAARF